MAEHSNLTNDRDPSVLMSPLREGTEEPLWTWGWFKRMDSEPPTVHCLPLDTHYDEKLMANGEPLFVRVANEAGDELGAQPSGGTVRNLTGTAGPPLEDTRAKAAPPRLDHSVETRTRRSGRPKRSN